MYHQYHDHLHSSHASFVRQIRAQHIQHRQRDRGSQEARGQDITTSWKIWLCHPALPVADRLVTSDKPPAIGLEEADVFRDRYYRLYGGDLGAERRDDRGGNIRESLKLCRLGRLSLQIARFLARTLAPKKGRKSNILKGMEIVGNGLHYYMGIFLTSSKLKYLRTLSASSVFTS